MTSQLHEVLVELFQRRPELAVELLSELEHRPTIPMYQAARVSSSEAPELTAAEYHADMVVVLDGVEHQPVYSIVVEVQLQDDARKEYSWPAYAVNLRARRECRTAVLVVTPSEAVARWARKPIDLDGVNRYTPFVIGPSGIPYVTEAERAVADPELAVLSAIAHGAESDTARVKQVVRAAIAGIQTLDEDRLTMYFDRIAASLSEAMRKELLEMDVSKYEFESEFAKHFIAKGRKDGLQEGRQEGRREGRQAGRNEALRAIVAKLLTRRFGALDAAVLHRLNAASDDDLERYADRILTAEEIGQVFGE